ncbi:cupin domain-containing protein [Hydromonas duriensis]|uniref:Cupin type-2 domain-containing protein n=1 Tax=Hydromonas duriensis TaxID=1527608 RepID=A0A4R6Y1M9_9BURK|nr:cupin domain-containing protein [Hydromonas duriensis]TDR29056.1 hypothetical protein DFR44_12715 [Hydromonas duriensis]
MVTLGEKTYPWHTHVDFDDIFLVIQGQLTIEMRTEAGGIERVSLGSGDLFVVPRGVEHRPVTDGSAYFLLIEPTVQGRID